MLDFNDHGGMPDEDITISTIPSAPAPVSSASAPDGEVVSPGIAELQRSEDKEERVVRDHVRYGVQSGHHFSRMRAAEPRSVLPAICSHGPTDAKKRLVWPWQLLSIGLACVLAYQRWEHAERLRAEAAPALPPTRSFAYTPLNHSVEVSNFPTPLAIGPRVPSVWCSVAFTIVVASSAAIPSILRRRRGRSVSCLPGSLEKSTLHTINFELADARSRLDAAIKLYSRGELREAVQTLSAVPGLACPSPDKAIASEWLGRTHYRLGRRGEESAQEHLLCAVAAFERSVRLDPGRASPRASLGRTLFRLGRYAEAVMALRAALKRDDSLAYAHEWLAKALVRLEPVSRELVERHLYRAVELDPDLYTAHAFLGEQLHLRGGGAPGRTNAAKASLLRAVALRFDYPAAHIRLAFIANEQLDSAAAARHYAAAVRTRQTGLRDPAVMPASEAALDGPSPYVAWHFQLPARSPQRLAVLRQASVEHPHDDVVEILLAIESTPRRRPPGTLSSCPDVGLVERETVLARRVVRYPPSEDLVAHGLHALVLLALGKDDAEPAYQRFWTAVVERRRCAVTPFMEPDSAVRLNNGEHELDRTVAYLAMAFFEQRAMPVPSCASAMGLEERPTPPPWSPARSRSAVRPRSSPKESPSLRKPTAALSPSVTITPRRRSNRLAELVSSTP